MESDYQFANFGLVMKRGRKTKSQLVKVSGDIAIMDLFTNVSAKVERTLIASMPNRGG